MPRHRLGIALVQAQQIATDGRLEIGGLHVVGQRRLIRTARTPLPRLPAADARTLAAPATVLTTVERPLLGPLEIPFLAPVLAALAAFVTETVAFERLPLVPTAPVPIESPSATTVLAAPVEPALTTVPTTAIEAALTPLTTVEAALTTIPVEPAFTTLTATAIEATFTTFATTAVEAALTAFAAAPVEATFTAFASATVVAALAPVAAAVAVAFGAVPAAALVVAAAVEAAVAVGSTAAVEAALTVAAVATRSAVRPPLVTSFVVVAPAVAALSGPTVVAAEGFAAVVLLRHGDPSLFL
ncbi:hypothetical protein GL305_25760 [Nocardia seriolae]|nr:hypothetical protein [Nocardia seriolae]MTL14817.1 hypothetical protein [Nocardia seriolae]